MILLHERMQSEASHLKGIIEKVYAFHVELREDSLDRFFDPLPRFGGYYYEAKRQVLVREFPENAVFLLTRRDLLDDGENKDDDWVFGASALWGPFSWVSTTRLMGRDSASRTALDIDSDLYLRRLSELAIHELGHNFVKAPHHQEASWVNAQNGQCVRLGKHCDDNSCVMYEIVDIITQPPAEGYLLLGDRRHYDAGLDEHLARIRPDWFCARCRAHLSIPEAYRR